jgi:PAS domain S-box-containing protein
MTFVDVTNLKKAEESHALLTTELGHRVGELQAILDAAPVALWIAHDPLCRRITGNTYANQMIMRTQPHDNVSQTAPPGESAVIYKVFRKGVQLAPEELPAQVATATGRRVPSEEMELVFEDGRRLTMILGAVPLLDADGLPRGAVTAGADITDRKRAEEALRQSEIKYRAVADNTYDWEFWVDSQGRFIYSSPSCERITGRKPEEFLANPDLRTSLLHPDDRASHTRHKREVEMMRTTREEEWRIAGPDGSWRWIGHICQPVYDAEGKFIGTRGTNHDITDRKRAVAAQEAERRLLEMILNHLPTPVALVEGEELRMRMVNKAYRDLALGTEVEGKRLEEVWSELGRETAEKFRRVLRTGEPHQAVDEVFMLRRSPEAPLQPMSFTWSLFRVPLSHGDGWGVLNVAWDTTERLRTDQALKKANIQLIEADRRKSEFLAVLSHELRNPLAPITNSLYVLDHATPGSEQARRAKTVIDRQVGQLARLVDDLLDVTRIARDKIHLQRQALELNELVRRTLDDHRLQFEKNGVDLTLTAAPEPIFIEGDWNRLAQVIGNLLQNAAKFTPRGGHTTVTVALDPAVMSAVVRVTDTGVGMSPEVLSRLFQPFMQADTSLDRGKGGLGLGLALVKGLVELHGGAIEAHSGGLGQGAEFVVRLPVETPDEARASVELRSMPQVRRRVLIIEDNLEAAESLREALEFNEHQVEVANTGSVGLAKARTFRPEVVLCDIGLPGMEGYDVARAFRSDEALKKTYLVALTGYALPEDMERAQEAGFDKHVAKPLGLKDLQDLLAEAPAVA